MVIDDKISPEMVAPCGICCTFCYVAQKKKKACPGCRATGEGKPNHCRKCKIKDCIEEKGLTLCSECSDFPCILIKRMDTSYRTRYRESLVKNMELIKEQGMENFLASEAQRLRCPTCGGAVSMHDKLCSECGKMVEVESLI